MPQSKTGTITPGGTASKVVIDDTWPHGVTINNLSGAAAGTIWYRLDGQDPAVEGDDSFPCFDSVFIPHPAVGEDYTPPAAGEAVEVRLTASTALKWHVEGNRRWKPVAA